MTTIASKGKQHLIDPGICIRCNSCEEACTVQAISHDDRNYVVDPDICEECRACIPVCPTGAIDNWFAIAPGEAYPLEEQFEWNELPAPKKKRVPAVPVPKQVEALTTEATAGQGGAVPPPWSAEKPAINLYNERNPITATVTGNYRLTSEDASADIRHIVLDFGGTHLPLLEGQNIGILTPGTDEKGRPHFVRLYSVASPREGERPGFQNCALTVKRVVENKDGKEIRGVCSNYLCDLKVGDKVQVIGPFGANFLMPNHAGSSLMMICTGTGAAPMRAMTERRRRRIELKEGGKQLLFFGARSEKELPYFGPLTKLPKEFIDVNFAFSRMPDQPKKYVQDRIRERHEDVWKMLNDEHCYIYLCGLKGMEQGVEEAFRDVCRQNGGDWDKLVPTLREKGRLHIETY